MAQLYRLEEKNDTRVGGVLVKFNSPSVSQLALVLTLKWVRNAPVGDSLTAAKDTAGMLLADLLEKGHIEEANATNWPSLTAALQRIISDWSDKRRAALHMEAASGKPLERQVTQQC